ncbi:MAG: AI-2E family transporter [Ardenticatenaceae bacterium]|nr:AI-2E family transporter [Ardenticatenaceae bacterium]
MPRFEILEIPLRQLVWWTLGIAAVVLCFWLLIRFQEILLLLLTALILSTAVRPGALWLEKHGIAKPVGLIIIFSLIAIFVVVLIWATVPVLVEQGAALGRSVGEGYQLLYQNLDKSTNLLVQRFLGLLPADLGSAAAGGTQALPELEMPVTPQATQGEQLVIGIAQAVAVIIFTFYWTLEGEYVKNALFMMVPLKKRNDARELVQKIEQTVGGYLLGQGLLCLIIGALAFVAYLLIGLPHALLLAIFAGLLEAVPIVGPFLGAVPAFIIGLSVSPATALWVVVATTIIQQLENSLLVPRVMSQTIGIRPLVSLLALLAFGSLYGVLGALIALPLAGVIQLLLDRYLLSHESLEQEEPGRDRLSVLRYETNQLVQDVRSQVRTKEGVPSAVSDFVEDELEALALDLESLLAAQGGGQR